MDEDKKKRIVVGATVTAILLLIILLFTMTYQLVVMSNKKREISKLDKAIAEYEQMIEDTESVIEARSKKWWIERRARELGYFYPGDVNYGGN